MMKSYHITCPKSNNNHSFYRYGKDSDGYQKYLCRNCHHQFAPELNSHPVSDIKFNFKWILALYFLEYLNFGNNVFGLYK